MFGCFLLWDSMTVWHVVLIIPVGWMAAPLPPCACTSFRNGLLEQKFKLSQATDISDVITAADRLCVPDLVDAAERDAAASLSADNVVALANFSWSGLSSLKILQAAAADYLRTHFEELLTRDDLCGILHLPIFLSLVACPTLCVRNEDSLLEAVLRRLVHGTHAKEDVVSLLGSIRLHQLGEKSVDCLSSIARGGTADSVVKIYEALQQGATEVVLGGLSSLRKGAVGLASPPQRGPQQRCCVVGRSGMVLWDPLGDQSCRVRSHAFHAVGHDWFLQVYTESEDGSPGTLAAYLPLKSSPPSPVLDVLLSEPPSFLRVVSGTCPSDLY